MMREWANNHIIRVNMVFLVRMMASVDVCLSISFYVRCIYCLMCIELLGQFTLFSLFFFLFLFLSITHSFARRVPKTKDTYLDAEAGRNLSAHLVFVRFICLFRCYHLYCNIQYYVIICCNLSCDSILEGTICDLRMTETICINREWVWMSLSAPQYIYAHDISSLLSFCFVLLKFPTILWNHICKLS